MKTLETINLGWACQNKIPLLKPREKPSSSMVRYELPTQRKIPLSIVIGLVALIAVIAVLFG
jgi:hypothetical protein